MCARNLFILTVGLLTVTLALPAFAQPANANPGVLPPQSTPYGKSYGEWSAAWWQWALSIPASENPLFDETGCEHGAVGQSGPVWFLTGVINVSGTAERTCTVPAGKALFFPIINVECSTVEPDPFHGDDEAELRDCAEFWFSTMDPNLLACEVDGVALQNLSAYRGDSPLFDFTLPEDNVLGVPAGEGQAVADGYYVMLAPLSVGEHEIHFSGSFVIDGEVVFTLDITYHLTVAPRAAK